MIEIDRVIYGLLRLILVIITVQKWEGQSEIWRIARSGIIDIKDREGKERDNYLVGEVQVLYNLSRR